MKEQEAIKYLKDGWVGVCYQHAKKMGIDALEKQIPKCIEEQTEDDREFIYYVCPNCKITLQQKMKSATRTMIDKYKYCHWCGQCLEWH